jgi:hypothetical protein
VAFRQSNVLATPDLTLAHEMGHGKRVEPFAILENRIVDTCGQRDPDLQQTPP